MPHRSVKKDSFDDELKKICRLALKEDKAQNDVTSDLTIKNNSPISFQINAREEIILCGVGAIHHCFDELAKLKKFKNIFLGVQINTKDGDVVKRGECIAQGFGDAKIIFAAERVILNLLQHLSGIATTTNQFVVALGNKKIKILDTRKTLPTLRALQKRAVVVGGGQNHRFNLSDMILIKDNHIAAAGSVSKAIEAATPRRRSALLGDRKLKIEVECDTVEQVAEAVKSRPDIIMLDNMKIADIQKSIKLINKTSKIEISGGVNLDNIKNFSDLEVDFISVGSLTHSARAVDIGLDI